MVKDKLFEKAAQQILCECLGFDEGRAYYLILIKKEKEIEKEFSYSKKYRLLKNLFEFGAIGKIKSETKDFFGYLPLPPSFLYAKKVSLEVISFLEQIYLKNHKNLLEAQFSQIILKDEKGFILFLLKYFMKDEAKIMGTEIDLAILGEDKEKVSFSNKLNTKARKIGIIDKKLIFEFSKIKNRDSHDYIGYISSKIDKEAFDLISTFDNC